MPDFGFVRAAGGPPRQGDGSMGAACEPGLPASDWSISRSDRTALNDEYMLKPLNPERFLVDLMSRSDRKALWPCRCRLSPGLHSRVDCTLPCRTRQATVLRTHDRRGGSPGRRIVFRRVSMRAERQAASAAAQDWSRRAICGSTKGRPSGGTVEGGRWTANTVRSRSSVRTSAGGPSAALRPSAITTIASA